MIHYGPSETRWDVAPDKDVAGLADQIKIIDSQEFEEYVWKKRARVFSTVMLSVQFSRFVRKCILGNFGQNARLHIDFFDYFWFGETIRKN